MVVWMFLMGSDIGADRRWQLGSLDVAVDKHPSCTGTSIEHL
jgi:hypothetical protein